MHSMNLSQIHMHTDLIVDVVEQDSKTYQEEKQHFRGGEVRRMHLTKEDALALGKKEGFYTTLSFQDVTDSKAQEEIMQVLEEEISLFLTRFSLPEKASCLLFGLGNKDSTPDALGPLACQKVTVTRHLFEMGLDVDSSYRPLASISPGVMAQTGIETQDYLVSLLEKVKPDFVVVVDALASNSLDRLMKTIQLTDTGIHPGSGIGNNRKEISKETLGIPVLALGVPTVVDAATIVQNTLFYLNKKLSYQKEKGNLPQNKFLTGHENTFQKQEDTLTKEEKKQLLGEVGLLNEEEQIALFEEVLTPLGYNLMVTSTEVDFLIENLAKIIGNSLEKTLHQKKS